jgi:hypothetical protein
MGSHAYVSDCLCICCILLKGSQVEKIRLIGASLLEIIDQYEASPLSVRARNDLSILLDILTRLDSKASDTLKRPS